MNLLNLFCFKFYIDILFLRWYILKLPEITSVIFDFVFLKYLKLCHYPSSIKTKTIWDTTIHLMNNQQLKLLIKTKYWWGCGTARPYEKRLCTVWFQLYKCACAGKGKTVETVKFGCLQGFREEDTNE